MVEGVQVLAVVQVPEQGLGVLAAGRAQRTVWGNGDGVQVAVVPLVVDLELAVGQVPDLDGAIPTARDDNRVAVVRRETDARHPVGVTVLLDGVLALGEGVPQLDGLVPGAGDDLTVVSAEGNREDILIDRRKTEISYSSLSLDEFGRLVLSVRLILKLNLDLQIRLRLSQPVTRNSEGGSAPAIRFLPPTHDGDRHLQTNASGDLLEGLWPNSNGKSAFFKRLSRTEAHTLQSFRFVTAADQKQNFFTGFIFGRRK